MNSNGKILQSIVNRVVPQMRKISDDQAARRPAPNKWSRKEVVGHLIDSANNNHRRFVIANLQHDLVFDGYSQDDWVTIQDYQHREWSWLIDFWAMYNMHLACLMDSLSKEVRMQIHEIHSLHRMAFKTVPEDVPTNLEYLIKDYLGHLEHHICQIIPDYQAVVMGTYEHSSSLT